MVLRRRSCLVCATDKRSPTFDHATDYQLQGLAINTDPVVRAWFPVWHCWCISLLTDVLQLAVWHFPYISYLYFWESRTLRAFPARVHSGPLSSRTRQQSDPHHLMNRLISLRGGFWKNQFHTSRMTTSVRNPSLTIGMNNWQGTDDLKKRTMDKTMESTLKTGMNTKLPTCDDKGFFTDDEGTYRKRK
jgi:hypothetical protein